MLRIRKGTFVKTLTLIALSCLVLTGCETCKRHPVACGVGLAVGYGIVRAATHHDDNSSRPDAHLPGPPMCDEYPSACR